MNLKKIVSLTVFGGVCLTADISADINQTPWRETWKAELEKQVELREEGGPIYHLNLDEKVPYIKGQYTIEEILMKLTNHYKRKYVFKLSVKGPHPTTSIRRSITYGPFIDRVIKLYADMGKVVRPIPHEGGMVLELREVGFIEPEKPMAKKSEFPVKKLDLLKKKLAKSVSASDAKKEIKKKDEKVLKKEAKLAKVVDENTETKKRSIFNPMSYIKGREVRTHKIQENQGAHAHGDHDHHGHSHDGAHVGNHHHSSSTAHVVSAGNSTAKLEKRVEALSQAEQAKLDNTVAEHKESKKRSLGNPIAWIKGVDNHKSSNEELSTGEKRIILDLKKEIESLKSENAELKKDEAQVTQIDEIRDGAYERYQRRLRQKDDVFENRIYNSINEVKDKLVDKDIEMEYLTSKVARHEHFYNEARKVKENINVDLSALDPRIDAFYSDSDMAVYQLRFEIPGKLFNQTVFKNFHITPYDSEGNELLEEPFAPNNWQQIKVDGAEAMYQFSTGFSFESIVSHFGITLTGVDVFGTDVVVDGQVKTVFDKDFTWQKMNHIGLYYLENSDDPRNAAMAFIEAIRLNRSSAALRYNLGNAYYRRNMLTSAFKAYQTGLKINSSDSKMRNALGHVMVELGARYIAEAADIQDSEVSEKMIYNNVLNQVGITNTDFTYEGKRPKKVKIQNIVMDAHRKEDIRREEMIRASKR